MRQRGRGRVTVEERWRVGCPRALLTSPCCPPPAVLSPSAWEFVLRACTVSERPPHFVLVTVAGAPPGEGAASPGAWGAALQARLQSVLDGCRAADIAAARQRQERQRAQALGGGSEGSGGEEEHEGGALTFEGAAAAAAAGGAAQQPVQVAQQPAAGAAEAAAAGAWPDLSRMGPLRLAFVSAQPADSGAGAEGGGGKEASGKEAAGGRTAALFEVLAPRSTPENSGGWCSVRGWPLRALNPARTAAATLLRHRAGGGGSGAAAGSAEAEAAGSAGSSSDEGPAVLAVEHYSRQPQDWCGGPAEASLLPPLHWPLRLPLLWLATAAGWLPALPTPDAGTLPPRPPILPRSCLWPPPTTAWPPPWAAWPSSPRTLARRA